jgi:hypothetical protein
VLLINRSAEGAIQLRAMTRAFSAANFCLGDIPGALPQANLSSRRWRFNSVTHQRPHFRFPNAPLSPITSPENFMKDSTKRSILRWIHLLLAFPIAGYVYSPFEELHNFAPVVRYFAVPVIVLTGLWMWKGAAVKRLFGAGKQAEEIRK